MPFPLGFPQGSLFPPSVPVSASTSIQANEKLPIPSTIQAGAERHSIDLGSTSTSVSTTDIRGSHSAPIMSDSHTSEGFNFPVKTEVQFYKAKIIVSRNSGCSLISVYKLYNILYVFCQYSFLYSFVVIFWSLIPVDP